MEKNTTLGTTNRITFETADGTTLTISTSTGLFSGKFSEPTGTKAKIFSGVLQQDAKVGGGYFLGTWQTGLVEFLAR